MSGRVLVLLALALVCVAPAHAEDAATAPDVRALLAQGTEVYGAAQGETARAQRLEGFRRAERIFRRVADTGAASASLQANIGNAALQADRLGQAVVAYRRALQREPSHARARQNLEAARGLLPVWVPTPETGGVLDTFFFWHRTVSNADRSSAAGLCFFLASLAASVGVVRRSSVGAWLAVLPAVAWLALIASLAWDPSRGAERQGVVVASELVARAADSANAPVLFGRPLPAGTELEILEDRGDWLQIRLHNGRTAWTRSLGVERIGGG